MSIKHSVSVTYEKKVIKNAQYVRQIKKCIQKALDMQEMFVPCEINVLLTNDDGIQAINKAYRGKDESTDVLSFPMFELLPGQLPRELPLMTDGETGLLPLGDMAISLEHVERQAKEFGHSNERELGYLTVHSVLHLLGYDHTDEGEMKLQMRAREEAILAELLLGRE